MNVRFKVLRASSAELGGHEEELEEKLNEWVESLPDGTKIKKIQLCGDGATSRIYALVSYKLPPMPNKYTKCGVEFVCRNCQKTVACTSWDHGDGSESHYADTGGPEIADLCSAQGLLHRPQRATK